MKNKNFFLFLSIIALLAVSPSCKKYEDGPAISLRSKKQRLCRTWFVKSITVGSISFEDSYLNDYKYDFKTDGSIAITLDGATSNGTWEFRDKKEDLAITVDGMTRIAEIHRLTSKELWFEQEQDDTDYLLKLEAN